MIRHHPDLRVSGAFAWCIAAVIGACSFLHCGLGPLAGGASEETNARVVGMVNDSAGNAASNARVQLVSSRYNPLTQTGAPDFPSDTTDENGWYEIGRVETGSYTLEAVDLQKRTRVLINDITVAGDSVTIPSATLRKPGTIKVMLPTGVDPLNGYVFLSGTTFGESLNDNADFVILDSVPAGIVPPLLYGERNSTAEPRILRDSITILPGKLETVNYAGWKSLKKLTLNTTASGANVVDTIMDFPLLVRLTSANFPFSQAKSDGSDLRFAKSDGTPLPYEIERWDDPAQTAVIWVRLDTVYGNDNSRSIFLYWGNSSAASTSRSASVFDTTAGFQGVWHLADNDLNSRVLDATGRNNGVMKSGTGSINTSSTYTDGIDGGAVLFRGSTILHWIDLGADKAFINNKSEVSISVWMNADADTFASKELICFSTGGTLDPLAPLSRTKLAINSSKITLSAFAADNGGRLELTSTKSFVPKQWYHITGVMKVPRDSIYLYVNGELWGSASAPLKTTATSPTNSANSAIGANDLGNDDYFCGKLDEARIEGTARSPGWIKLSYMNQKEVDALIK